MSGPLLRVQGLCKRFGGVLATDAVSLEVQAGEIHALIGPNGAGKTSLIAQLAGNIRPDAGQIWLGDQNITRLPAHQRVRQGLVRSFQITRLFRSFTALENLAIAAQVRQGGNLSFWRLVAADHALEEEARHWLRAVGLAGRENVIAATLSHGEQRALEVGLALATRPRLLLLDEPMAGTGPEDGARMEALIERLRTQTTVLLVEHDVDAVFRLANRVTVLVNGRVIASGEPAAVRADQAVIAAYLGDEAAA